MLSHLAVGHSKDHARHEEAHDEGNSDVGQRIGGVLVPHDGAHDFPVVVTHPVGQHGRQPEAEALEPGPANQHADYATRHPIVVAKGVHHCSIAVQGNEAQR